LYDSDPNLSCRNCF